MIQLILVAYDEQGFEQELEDRVFTSFAEADESAQRYLNDNPAIKSCDVDLYDDENLIMQSVHHFEN